MTVVPLDPGFRSPTKRRLGLAACWLALGALIMLAGLPAGAQSSETAIEVAWTVTPDELGPGSAFEIDGVVTIDPPAAAAVDGALAWTVTVGPIDDAAIDGAECEDTDGLSCEAEVDANGTLVTFAGVVEDDSAAEVTANVTITGTIDDELDRDAILFRAATCGTVEAASGTPAPGRLPVAASTPVGTCDGTPGTIEATIAAATVVPTEEATPTEEPTVQPTATPEPTATVAPTEEPTVTPEPTATETPTEEPTAEPTATAEPTLEPTVQPTEAPTATSEPTATVPPTEAATATVEPTAEPTATVVPTATAESTTEPTSTPSATEEMAATTQPTIEPTDIATDAPTATTEPTDPTPTETPGEPATEAPLPVPAADNDGGSDTGLWVGVGSLVVLAVAAGAVLYQRRKLSA